MARASRQRSTIHVWQDHAAEFSAEDLVQQLKYLTDQFQKTVGDATPIRIRRRARLISDISTLVTALNIETVRQGVATGCSYTKLGQWLEVSPTSVMTWANELRKLGHLA